MTIVRERARHEPVLDPVERASEAIFGVLMVLSITGSLSVATAGRQEVGAMMLTAVGCNLAWGLTDAVMYLIGAVTMKNRQFALLRRVQKSPDASAARRVIAGGLPDGLAAVSSEDVLEAIRQNLVSVPASRAVLDRRDFSAALGVFALVVLVTFPVVLPFLFVHDVWIAMRVSNGIGLAILYGYGHTLGQYSGGTPWKFGLVIMLLGVVLVAVIMALGG
jgi:hypothetical protein